MKINMGLSRRGLLSGAAMLTTAFGLDPVRMARAAGALDPLPASGIDEESFLALSVVLTGHENLDASLGTLLLRAMLENGQAEGLSALHEALRIAAGDPDAVADVVARSEYAATAQAALRGWYTGLVDTPTGETQRIAYEDALMGSVVNDFLELRSYCGGEPHFWTELPDLAEPIVVSEATP